MYLNFYGLSRKPFHTTPDPDFLYLSPSHKQALGSIIYGIQEKKGFIAVTGEVGLGKTTMLRSYLSQANDAQNQIVYLLNPHLSFKDLLKVVLRELNHDPVDSVELELVSQLHGVLIDQYSQGKTVIVLIDEAQNMPVATLESLRMLSNLETAKDKLIQIVLVGQPELDTLLGQHDLRQLNQRIAVRATIVPLSKRESYDYIRHRLAKAGSRGKQVFSGRALSLIIRQGQGNPRRLTILCDNALVTGLGYKKKPVSAAIAKEVIADLNGTTHRASWKWVPLAACSIVLICVAWLTLFKSEGFSIAPYVAQLRGLIRQETEMAKVQANPQEDQEHMSRDEIVPNEKEESFPRKPIPDDKTLPETPSHMDKPLTVSRVQEGDTLETLSRKVYGTATPKHMKQILDANPHIADSKKIFPGQTVVFPRIPTPVE